MGARENTAVARRLAACEQTHPGRAKAWRRLAALMLHLARSRRRPSNARNPVLIPDGKYQMQVFALDDAADGPSQHAAKMCFQRPSKRHVVAAQPGAPGRYTVYGKPHAILIEQLDGRPRTRHRTPMP